MIHRNVCSMASVLVIGLGIVLNVPATHPSVAAVPPGVIFEVLALNKDIPTPVKPKYRSPSDLTVSADSTKLYICEQTAKQIAVFNLSLKTIEKRIKLPNEVTGCVASPDGTLLYATCGSEIWPAGYVYIVNIAAGKAIARIAVGHYPRSPVLSPDGGRLYVCNMFSNDVSVIDVAAQRELRKIKVVREPYCADITPDGTTLVVGNSLPADRSLDSEFVSCKISIINLEDNRVDTSIRLTRGSHSVFGLSVSPDGRYAFATHLIGKFNLIGTKVEGGWLHTNNLAVIDIKEKKFLNQEMDDLVEYVLSL